MVSKYPEIATKECPICKEIKMIAIDFPRGQGWVPCNACRRLRYLKSRQKSTQLHGEYDSKMAWKNRNFSIKQKKDIRDSILEGDACH